MSELHTPAPWEVVKELLINFQSDANAILLTTAYGESINNDLRHNVVTHPSVRKAMEMATSLGLFAVREDVEVNVNPTLATVSLRLCKVNPVDGVVMQRSWRTLAQRFGSVGDMIPFQPFNHLHLMAARRLLADQQRLGWLPLTPPTG